MTVDQETNTSQSPGRATKKIFSVAWGQMLVASGDRAPLEHSLETSDKNEEKYQSGDYKLIQYQILQTNTTRTVWQTVTGITNEILGVKGLTS